MFGQILRRFPDVVKGDRARGQRGLTAATTRGITARMMIYKILRAAEWSAFQASGETTGAPVDLADGFIHFSTAEQAAETAARHFSGQDDLMLLAFDDDTMGDALKWEVSRGGALFPHLYRSLHLSELAWALPLPLLEGRHRFPEEMA